MTTPTDQGTQEQARRLAWLNDVWGVRSWELESDGVLAIELEDGDEAVVERDGSWRLR